MIKRLIRKVRMLFDRRAYLVYGVPAIGETSYHAPKDTDRYFEWSDATQSWVELKK